MTSLTPNEEISNPYPYPSMLNVANFVSIKLTETNYIPWKTQITCLLKSLDLFGFVDGTISPTGADVDVVDDDEEPSSSSSEDEEKEEEGDNRGEVENEDYLRLRRTQTDLVVKGWIIGSLSEGILVKLLQNVVDEDRDLQYARDVWWELVKIFNPMERAKSRESKIDFNSYLPLYRASLSGNWKKAKEFLDNEKEANRAQINSFLQTALHVATGAKNDNAKHFLENLVASMSDNDVAMQDCNGDTPLHYAAKFGNLYAAELLVNKNPDLPHIPCYDGLYPIHCAAEYGYISKDVVLYLLDVTKDPAPFKEGSGIRLLTRLIHSDLYDVAMELVEEYPDLAIYKLDDRFALKELAMKEFAFLSGSHLNRFQRLLYSFVPIRSTSRIQKRRRNGANNVEIVVNTTTTTTTKPTSRWLPSMFERIYVKTVIKKLGSLLFNVVENLVPRLKRIRHKKSIHHAAVKFAECLCQKMENLNDEEVDSMVSAPLLEAARYDTSELVEIIVERFPSLAYHCNGNQKNIFHIAIQHRCENVFNLAYQMSQHRHQLMNSTDIFSNTMLHLAAKLAPQVKLNRVSGAALQMQRELQWFKEVKKFVPSSYWEFLNGDNKTPHAIFSEEHESLKIEGEKWMKDTANSCTISAALIATIAFAAAITVPGGNDGQSGRPIFNGDIAFVSFAISNAASLFTSSTSLLVFLSIMTSRYAEQDFMYTLPRSLILGLLTLFLSITFMMISFSATVHLVFGQKKAWFVIPVAAMAGLPITSFVLMQFPLLVALLSSTYGHGIFGKKSDRPFY